MGFSGKTTGEGCHFLCQGIFPPQGSSPRLLRLLHWRVGATWAAPIQLTSANCTCGSSASGSAGVSRADRKLEEQLRREMNRKPPKSRKGAESQTWVVMMTT